MGLDGRDDREMLGRITVFQIGIKHLGSRNGPSSLLLYAQDLVDNADHEAVAARLYDAAMKKLVPSVPGGPVFSHCGMGSMPLHAREIGWLRSQGGETCGLGFNEGAGFKKLAQCCVCPQCLGARLNGLGPPSNKRALADMAPNPAFPLQFIQAAPQRGPVHLEQFAEPALRRQPAVQRIAVT